MKAILEKKNADKVLELLEQGYSANLISLKLQLNKVRVNYLIDELVKAEHFTITETTATKQKDLLAEEKETKREKQRKQKRKELESILKAFSSSHLD